MRRESDPRMAARRPRILELVNSFQLGGTEGQVVELLRGLRRNFDPRAGVLQAQGPHLASVRGLGLEPYEVRLPPSLARPGTMVEVARLARFLRREKIDLVHAQDFYTTLVGVPAAKLAGAKVVVSRLDLCHWLGPAKRIALAAACRMADHVVVNARAIQRQIRAEERLPAERITVIPNGIDLDRFDRDRAAGLHAPLPDLEGKVVVANVANMTHPVKAQEDLLVAMRELQRDHPEIALLLVGDGQRRAELEKLAAELGVARSVWFLGRRTDVPALLARSDIGVLCSHAEGLSNSIIEGMAAALPMVVTNAGGNRELVKHGVSGYVVPPKSPRPLAARLASLAGSKAQRTKMGRAGRAFVEKELGLDRLISRHEAVYRRVLQGAAEPARTFARRPAPVPAR